MILDQITSDLKDAMKEQNQQKVDTLRMLVSSLKKAQIDSKEDLDEKEELSVLKREVKQRRDAAEQYNQSNRKDLAEKEETEIKVIEEYLPEMMGAEKVEKIVDDVISETGASSMADMGKVMSAVMAKTGGAVDGKQVSDLVKTKLQ